MHHDTLNQDQAAASQVNIWMPLYIGDYLAETTRLGTVQHGAYLLLLMDYWRNGPPPADEAVLAQITRMSRAQWRRIAPTILARFLQDGGVLRHDGLDRERAKAQANQEAASGRARRAAQTRWGKRAETGDTASDARAMLDQCPSPSTSTSPSTTPTTPPSSSPAPSPPPTPAARPGPSLSILETPSSAHSSLASCVQKVRATPEDPVDEEPGPEPWPEAQPSGLLLPLRDGAVFTVTRELLSRSQVQYPALNVHQQFRQMQAWLEANPRRRKDQQGVQRFVHGWLARQQEQAPPRPAVSYLGDDDVM